MTSKQNDPGAVIQVIRNELGLTQVQLSKLIGYSANTISLYETNEAKPPLAYLLSLLYIRSNLVERIEQTDLHEILESIKSLRTCAACGSKYRHLKKPG